MRITEKLAEYKSKNKPFYSFEFFPPKTETGLQNLYGRLDRMATLNPVFIDITWGAGGSTADLTLDMAQTIQQYFGLNVLMHLTCTNMAIETIDEALTSAHKAGVTNILALRGDPPEGTSKWTQCEGGFNYAKDLVAHIKKNWGDKFCIGVAGYPEGHSETPDIDTGVKHLKEKVDAGADFVITQLFYDVERFFSFRNKAIDAGISVPIIPGIMPIHNYSRFLKFTSFADINVPSKIMTDLELIKSDDAKVLEYGIEQSVDMCTKLIEGGVSGLHFYTLNLETSVVQILQRLDVCNTQGADKAMPWRQSTLHGRNNNEDVRPIFWSNRPVSYLKRTQSWDDFPNGRWGDRTSPTFGELNSYHLFRHSNNFSEKAKNERLALWGEPETKEDIANVFTDFCLGKIKKLPWCQMPLASESAQILSDLADLNKKGFLTINSQPRVNAAKSEDAIFGWGGEGGRVYQKAYLEFFAPKELVDELVNKATETSSISIQAINLEGHHINTKGEETVSAVTWGVFPDKEIIQPTVVDTSSFKTWKDEAFALWMSDWAEVYETTSKSYQVIKEIHDNYYLVNVVDHDFIDGNIFALFS